MPFIKPVKSLYDICVKIVYDVIHSYCTYLRTNQIENRSLKIAELNSLLSRIIPADVLDDVLLWHLNSDNEPLKLSTNNVLNSYYFYKAILHKNVRKFQAKNHNLSLSHWKCLFKSSFQNLKVLNLALSCNDAILELIPKYCPNLEWLNATCKYERINHGANAASFTTSVTDFGLGFLCDCKKLKVLTINDPRSCLRGLRYTITYEGIRKLLREVRTLEDVTYGNLGKVIAKNMEDVESLNLNIVRHFNATETSLLEILRLCKHIQELYLVFFKYDDQHGVMEKLLSCSYRLLAFGVQNLNFGDNFVSFFEKIGSNLVYLSISNDYVGLNFADLVTIGRSCPNLKSLGCSTIDNRCEPCIHRPYNFNQFQQLENLFITGLQMDVVNVVKFLTQNAVNLKNFELEEKLTRTNVDNLLEEMLPINVEHIEMGRKLELSREGVKKLIEHFVNIRYLSVYCGDEECNDLLQYYRNGNYDFTFINKIDNPF